MHDIKKTNYFFISIIRYYILSQIILIFYLSYNNKEILYKPIIFIIIGFFLSSLLLTLGCNSKYQFLIILVFIFYLLALSVNSRNVFNPSFDKNRIKEIEGYVVRDQSETKSGAYYLIINCNKGYLKDKTSVSVKGEIPIMFDKDYDLLVFTPLRARVEYDKEIDIYKAKDVTVLSENKKYGEFFNKVIFRIRDNRILLLKKIKGYIHTPLARMLLLGRSDQRGFVFKEYALSLGCAHLLALSGMHLSIITVFFTFFLNLFFNQKQSKYLVIIFIFYFIYLTGPIPSLLRSLIMYLLNLPKIRSEIKSEIVLLLSAILQALIFPSTFISAGCLFSYGALCAIFLYSSIFDDINKILSSILTTVFAILVTYPLSLSLGGSWCILSIILAPSVTIFVTFEMIVALALLINSVFVDFNYLIVEKLDYGIVEAIIRLFINIAKEINFYFHKIIYYDERLITSIFEKGSFYNNKLPNYLISTKGYLIFALLVLTSLAVYLYATHSFKFRSYK
jgi:ComEC/Rec2-related protein